MWVRSRGLPLIGFALLGVLGGTPSRADAATDVVHVVSKGETIEQLAAKYGVTVKALSAANKPKDPTALKPGSRLIVPGGSRTSKTTSYAAAPRVPGRVAMRRFGARETHQIQLATRKGRLVPGALPRLARAMRFGPLNLEHSVEPRLAALLARVSDHFGGRTIDIISGFRPKMPTQYTPHSNHNVGRAIDIRIAGVPNEVLRDYCRTFKQTGVGYYPNSLFVHFDVRKESTYWIDLSRPGEPPRYVGSQSSGDHGADEASAEGIDLTPDEATPAAPAAAAAANGGVGGARPEVTNTPDPSPSTGGGAK